MRRKLAVLSGLAVLACAAAMALAAGAAETSPARDWKGIVDGLGSSNFATRESAQKELEKVPRAEYAAIKRLAEETADPEVRSRLIIRIEVIEDEIAFDPGPIDLQVQNATFSELMRALSAATRSPLFPDTEAPETSENVRYTLNEKGKPFWDIFLALSAQHPMNMGGTGRAWYTGDYGPGIQTVQQVGGFIVYASDMKRSRLMPPDGRVSNEEVLLSFRTLADPRMRVVAVKRFWGTKVVDSLGNVLYDAQADEWAKQNGAANFELCKGSEFLEQVRLKVPAAHGTTFSFSGEGQFYVGSGEVRREFPDIEQIRGAITLSNTTVKISGVKVIDGAEGKVTMTYSAGTRQPYPDKPLMSMPVTVRVVDAAGRELWFCSDWWEQTKTWKGPIAKPVKVILTAPVRSKEVHVPFAFKDLPLPY